MTVQVLMSPGCDHGAKTVELVRDVLSEVAPDARLETVVVQSREQAEALRFPGSPTVLVDGLDIEPGHSGGAGFG